MTRDGWIWCCIYEGDQLREVVISPFHGVCHLQRPEMTVKLLKLTSHVLKACKCHPHIPFWTQWLQLDLNISILKQLNAFLPPSGNRQDWGISLQQRESTTTERTSLLLKLQKVPRVFSVWIYFSSQKHFFIIPNQMFSLTLSKCQSSIFWQVHFRMPVHLLSCSSQSLMS